MTARTQVPIISFSSERKGDRCLEAPPRTAVNTAVACCQWWQEDLLSTHALEVLFEAQVLGLGLPDALERLHQDVAVDEQAKPEHGPHFHSHLPRSARQKKEEGDKKAACGFGTSIPDRCCFMHGP